MHSVYVCSVCAHLSPRALPRCPKCGQGTLNRVESDTPGADPPAGWKVAERKAEAVPSPAPEPGPPPVLHIPAGEPVLACGSCGYETDGTLRRCPRCGEPILSPRAARGLGWVLVACGVFLMGLMGWLTVVVANIIANSSRPDAATRFTGGPTEQVFIFSIFGTVFAFGLGSFLAGAWQIRYGKRNRRIIAAVLFLGALLWIVGTVVQVLD